MKLRLLRMLAGGVMAVALVACGGGYGCDDVAPSESVDVLADDDCGDDD
jgi:hypothetical protein